MITTIVYGILVENSERSDLPSNPSEYAFLIRDRDLLPGPVIVFTLKGVDCRKRQVHGYMLQQNTGKWSEGFYPIPHVVFNRSYLPSITQTRLWKWTKGKTFNSHLWISKRRTFQILKKYPQLAKHLPPTFAFSKTRVRQLLKKGKCIYLKPVQRSQGRGIIRVWPLDNGCAYSFMKDKKLYRGRIATLDELSSTLDGIMYHEPYIIQEAIELATINNYKFDLRIIVIANSDRKWYVRGSYAKIAPVQVPVTNISQVGRVARVPQILAVRFGKQRVQELWNSLVRLSVRVSQAIAAHYSHMAVLGHDFAIDEKGKIWFLETNAYPGFDSAVKTREVAKAIWDYARSLTT